MSIKKSLLALAAMALAAMALAPAAMAGGGSITHVETGEPIPEGTIVEYAGWAGFQDASGTGIECHVEATTEAKGANGETGTVTEFDPVGNDTDFCTLSGDISHCHMATNGVEAKNLPYHLTTGETDVEAEGQMVLFTDLTGFFCPDITLTVDSPLTLEPLETDSGATGTQGNIGNANTTEPGEPIAGVELLGTSETHDSLTGTNEVTIGGELEVQGEHFETWVLD